MSKFKPKPRVLIVTTSRWVPTARLAVALANAGCEVEAVCPARHPLSKTSVLQRTFPYHAFAPLMSFADAISAAKPDLIVPGDDLATHHLHDLYQREQHKGTNGTLICALIERSLGSPASFPVVYARTSLMELAHEEGVRVPKTAVIKNIDDLRKWIDLAGLPAVLKVDGTSGGDGVKIVRTIEEAERAFRTLQAPPSLARAIKRSLIDRDRTLLWPSLLGRRSPVNVQAFVAGREATSMIACWKGVLLASLHFEVVKKLNFSGPATVVRVIENPEMSAAAERVVRRLDLSGLHGFDFMIEGNTGNAYLIEMNPRATQVGHLTLGPGRDLPAALYAAAAGTVVQEAPKITDNATIALFPQEWKRDSASDFLQSGYHDVPWGEPALIRDCVRSRRKITAWYSRKKDARSFSAAFLPHL